MTLLPRYYFALLLGLLLLPWNSTFAQRDEFYFGGAAARVRVVNRMGGRVNVYQLDRWDGQEWVGSVDGDSEASFRARPRQTLIVTNSRGEVLSQTPVSSEGATVVVGGDRGGYGRGDEGRDYGRQRGGSQEAVATLQFKNKTGSKVKIFRIDRDGNEEKLMDLDGGKEWEKRSELGRQWFVKDKSGRIVERFVVRGDQRITIR